MEASTEHNGAAYPNAEPYNADSADCDTEVTQSSKKLAEQSFHSSASSTEEPNEYSRSARPSVEQVSPEEQLASKNGDDARRPSSVSKQKGKKGGAAPLKKKRKKSSLGASSSATAAADAAGLSAVNGVDQLDKNGVSGASAMQNAALEKQVQSVLATVKLYKSRLSALIETNSELKQELEEREADTIDILRQSRTQAMDREKKIEELEKQIIQERVQNETRIKNIKVPFEAKIKELQDSLMDRDCTIRQLEEEVASVKDFRRRRAEMMREIAAGKAQIEEMQQAHKDTVSKIERRFLMEKMRFQQESTARISEIATKAHREAVATMNNTTRTVYRENLRLTEALKSHLASAESLSNMNAKLTHENQVLRADRTTSRQLMREKIIELKNEQGNSAQQKNKIADLENTLSRAVREFESDREILKASARTEISKMRSIAAVLRMNLQRKAKEMAHIRRVATHVLDMRTDVELFFMDALEQVRKEIAKETETDNKKKHYIASLSPHLRAQKLGATAPEKLEESVNPKSDQKEQTQDLHASKASDIASLSWKDKEKVLRALFARMNGAIKKPDRKKDLFFMEVDDEPKPRSSRQPSFSLSNSEVQKRNSLVVPQLTETTQPSATPQPSRSKESELDAIMHKAANTALPDTPPGQK